MTLSTFDTYPRHVLRVLLALRELERQQRHATYAGLRYMLRREDREPTREGVRWAVAAARKLELVANVEDSSGGSGHKVVFGLTEKGREALRD